MPNNVIDLCGVLSYLQSPFFLTDLSLILFIPLEGFVKGHPLSHYVFIMCIEILSHLSIIQTLEPHQFQEMNVFSHTFYVLQGYSLQRRTLYIYCYGVPKVLVLICNLSGQKANLGKFEVLYSSNVAS